MQLRELTELVAVSPVTAVVTGMRGVGKTQLAAAYARAALSMPECELVGWVDAETDGTLYEGLAAIAERLGVADPEGGSRSSALRLRDHLNGRTAVALLVFDNATDPDLIAEFLPAHGGTRVVITSTDRDFATLGAAVDLAVYDRQASVRYLHEATGRPTGTPDDAGAASVAHELGDLPLALTQAAATITARRLSFADYRQLLAEPLPRAFTRRRGDPHRQRVDKAILLSVDTTETPSGDGELDAAVTELLDLVAMLSPTGVRRDLLPGFGGRRDEAIARCVQGSLLAWSDDDTTVVMHRLVARVLRDRADPGEARIRLAANAVAALEPHLFDHSQAWRRRVLGSQLIEHIDAIADTGFAEHDPGINDRLFEARSWAGNQLVGAVELSRGIEYIDRTRRDAERHWGLEHPHSLTARHNLAYALDAAGRVAEASTLLEQLLPDRERIQGAEDPNTLATRAQLAFTYRAGGRVTEAITMFEQLLTDQQRIRGAEHRDTLATRANLAYTYQHAGRVWVAINLLLELLPDQERIQGADHPDTSAVRASLAYAYRAAEQVDDALAVLEPLLLDQERLLGNDHPGTLAIRASLADTYVAAGRSTEAISLYQQLVPARERILGPEHPDTLTARHNLAFAYLSAGLLPEALGLSEWLLPRRQRVLGAEHPDTLATRHNIAFGNQCAGEITEAITMYEQLLPDQERVLGAEHPNSLRTRHNLAGAYETAGRVAEAIDMYEQLVRDEERILGAEHPDTLTTRHDLAYTYDAARRTAEAIDLYERLLPDVARVFEATSPIARATRDALDAARRRQARRTRWERLTGRFRNR
ncbi:tetratricopeptide repeat protein [Nocardia brasiliensis]